MKQIRSLMYAVLGMLSLLTAVSAQQQTAPDGEILYPCLDKLYRHSSLLEAYNTVVRLYAVDPNSHECIPAASMGAGYTQGRVVVMTGNRLWMTEESGRKIAVIGHFEDAYTNQQQVGCMVMRSKSGTIVGRDKFHKTHPVPQYVDVTMTFNDFLGFLRLGYHFPEVPSLETEPDRRRMFATKRIERSKVNDAISRSKYVPGAVYDPGAASNAASPGLTTH